MTSNDTMEDLEATYEVEAYQAVFKDAAVATSWLDAKRKLLEDAGLRVVQYSCYEARTDHINANIQAVRGSKPDEEPLF
jgi:hypothetical protein